MFLKEFFQKLKIVWSRPFKERRSVWELLNLFQETSRHSQRFQNKTNLKCLSGCGRCCENPQIETTVFEMMPAATFLLNKNQTEMYWELAQNRDFQGECVFYQRDPVHQGKGRCRIYPFRPLICRLFGFSVKKNKHGERQIVTCPTIKSSYAVELKNSEKVIQDNPLVTSDINNVLMKAYGLNPQLGKQMFPINEALRQAIERVGLKREILLKD